jgi:PAS domain S-box-containing protein
METDDRLELFFSQSLDGFFFMMIDEPIRWDDSIDKEKTLDYVFEHQRITKVNDAMLAQYGATRERFLGLTPSDLFKHDLAYGRRVWREFFDRGRWHLETDERRVDGTPIQVEGDYLCFYDAERRITGHFGIQRDVTARRRSDEALRQFNRRLLALQEIHLEILASRSPKGVAQTAIVHIQDLLPCRSASVAVVDDSQHTTTILAATGHDGVSPPEGDPGSTVINVPLVAEEQPIGVLTVSAPEGRSFTAEHIDVVHELANTLSVAIRQAQLRERVERYALELEARVATRTEALRASEERLAAIVSALPDLVFVVDADGRFLDILTSREELLERAAADMKGRRLHELVPAALADAQLRLVQQTLQTGVSQALEYSLEVQAGERWFEARTGLLRVDVAGQPAVAVIARDITDKKRAEELESQKRYLQEELKAERSFGEIVGRAAAMQSVFESIEMVAPTDSTVLILGETGTGKELIARAIHESSRRRQGVMVKVNCGALPTHLAESELFGHERGAFTGAVQQKKGRFELASHGTIFLDEVGELSAEVQVKLLRVLQEQEIERLGSTRTTKVDVRVIAATNRNLDEEVQRGTFRADLFYRLNIFPIRVPPLRERLDDVPLLTQHFIADLAQRMRKPITGISPEALSRLKTYHWPGNVRELANVIERAVILCQGRLIVEEHLAALQGQDRGSKPASFPTLADMERLHIMRALEQTGGILAGPQGAARLLGMSRSTIWSRMRKLGIRTPGH